MDWVDYADRNAAASPDEFAAEILKRAEGHKIWMVWSTGYRTFDDKCEQILNALGRRPGRGTRPSSAPTTAIYEFMGLTRYDP